MPGARIGQVHGTTLPAAPATGARDATVFAMYHPAAALRSPSVERESFADIAGVPVALLDARRRREEAAPEVSVAAAEAAPTAPAEPTAQAPHPALPPAPLAPPASPDDAIPQLTLF